MPAFPDAAVLAYYLADGCAKILLPLLCFLGGGGPSTRSPAVDEAASFLLVLLPTAYLVGVLLAHFAGVVLAPMPATTAAAADPARFVVLLLALVAAWLLLIVVPFAAVSFFLGAGKRGSGPGVSSNVLS
ncbi:hypothetical protein VPH35_127879 [Triticum aestivum]